MLVLGACALAGQTPAERAWEQASLDAVQQVRSGDYAGAEKLLEQVVREAASAWQGDPRLAAALSNLASLYQDLGRYAKAEKFYLRSAEIWEGAGGGNLARLSECLNSLASVYLDSGQPAKAQRLLAGRVTDLTAALGPGHQEVVRLLLNLGAAHYGQGRYSEAEAAYRQALVSWESDPRRNLTVGAAIRNNLGAVYLRTGRTAEARSHFERAAVILEGEPADMSALLKTLLNLSTVATMEHRWEEGEGHLKTALGIAEKTFGPDHPLVAYLLSNHAVLLRKTHRKSEAKQAESRAKTILAGRSGEDLARYTVDFADLPPRARRRR
jgi:tetratricopeptide (TPR) repeat protein